MWIVQLALRRPYTFVVLALLLAVLGPLAIVRTPTDIFPNINIPVLSIVWSYNGFSAKDMANRITTPVERALTTDVQDIEHIDSQSLGGVAVIKLYLHPGANVSQAMAEVVAASQGIVRVLPPGTQPPIVVSYNASTVPILQLALSSKTLPEQELYDLGNSFIRTQLATVQGSSVPLPFGGKIRQVMVDIDPAALQAYGIGPLDVVNAVNAQALILPSGTAKIGALEYNINLNASPDSIVGLNDLPIKTRADGSVLYVHDVATVRDGFAPQTNVVRVNGKRAALLQIEKSGDASTLTIIGQIQAMLPHIQAGLPKALQIKPFDNQALFVSAAVSGVAREGLIAAGLTGLMILLFLASWRATLIIAITIPLSIITSLLLLSLLGNSINIMTLGGLALAVGILVDDATVAIENISHHRELGESLHDAIVNASAEIALPTLVSTLSICIVFTPMFLLPGVAGYLFRPLAEAVVFAMLASYFFSRSLIPTLALYLFRHETVRAEGAVPPPSRHPLVRFQRGFEARFERLRLAYQGRLHWAMAHPRRLAAGFVVVCACSLVLLPFLGRDFFPAADGDTLRLHLRAKTGTRVQTTAQLTGEVEKAIRRLIPAGRLDSIIDNIGLPVSGINLTYDASSPVGSADADITVTLTPDGPTASHYVTPLRDQLNRQFPGVSFAFLPADIVSQILDFGLPAPIDIQLVGKDEAGIHTVAQQLLAWLRHVPGLVDARIQQPDDQPAIDVAVDRTRALQAGFTQREVAQNLLIALSGSSQTTPNFWLDPNNGVSYLMATMVPQYDINSLQALGNISLSNGAAAMPQGDAADAVPTLASLSHFSHAQQDAEISHYNVQPVIDIFGGVQGRDLGGVAKDIDSLVAQARKQLPPGASIVVRGEIQTMATSFSGLFTGLALAVVLVYALMVVNFQSWIDPLIIIGGLPGAMCGICWMLFVTGTTLSVPALTGAIMCIGIATANSILVITFARQRLALGDWPLQAAFAAGSSRFRPVLMTSLAMVIGMLPMATGLGDGGQQNAPLGRAVIGGLLFGTATTLLFVPVLFGAVHHWLQRRRGGQPAAPSHA